MEDKVLAEKRRKKAREQWWKRILAYYMMEKMVEERKKEEILRNYAIYHTAIVIEEGMMSLLFFKEPGRMSPMELLEKIEEGESEDSPFRELINKIRKQPMSEEETEEAIAEVVEKAPPMILEEAKAERDRQETIQRQEEERKAREPEARPVLREPDPEAIRYNRQLRLKLAFLKKLMPAILFNELCQGLAREGHVINVNALDIQDPIQPRATYESYIAEKQTQLQAHNSRFVNADNVYTSAAYMLAAYEQKDSPRFNAAQADARARELFGSKAFRVYLDSHPGSLVAASQNAFLDITHEGVMKLEEELTHRDRILGTVSRNLRRNASGQTANYHRMLNKMERFVKSQIEPSDADKKNLVSAIGEYVLKDCAPGSQVGDEEAMMDALCAAQVLLPEDSFAKLLEQVNAGRSKPLTANDVGKPNPENEAEERELQQDGPVLLPD